MDLCVVCAGCIKNLTYRHSFFTDPTISALTSGRPSQNTDLASLSFPRKFGVRFRPGFLKRYKLTGMQAKWDSFEDRQFTRLMDPKLFHHDDTITREGWARYYFDGKYPKNTAYVRLQVADPQKGYLIRSFFFRFTKDYRKSLDGQFYVKDPILGEKVVHGGTLTEMVRVKDKEGNITYRDGHTFFEEPHIDGIHAYVPIVDDEGNPRAADEGGRMSGEERVADVFRDRRDRKKKFHAILQTQVRYTEKPKAIFLVTPPHLIFSLVS